jgi:hypothetical protein
MGHSIDKLQYDKSFRDVEFYKGEYMKALPFLQIISGGAAFGQVHKSEIEELLRKKTLEQNGLIKELQDKVRQLEKEKNNELSDIRKRFTALEELVEMKATKEYEEKDNAADS